MKRASDLLGMPVTDANGDSLGVVDEVLVDFSREHIGGLLISDKSSGVSGYIAVDDIVFSPDALIIPSDAIIQDDGAVILRQGKLTLEEVRKLVAATDSGRRLGNVADLIVEDTELVALELSDGLLQDVFAGRNILPLPIRPDIAAEKLIVSDGAGVITPDSSGEGQNPDNYLWR